MFFFIFGDVRINPFNLPFMHWKIDSSPFTNLCRTRIIYHSKIIFFRSYFSPQAVLRETKGRLLSSSSSVCRSLLSSRICDKKVRKRERGGKRERKNNGGGGRQQQNAKINLSAPGETFYGKRHIVRDFSFIFI